MTIGNRALKMEIPANARFLRDSLNTFQTKGRRTFTRSEGSKNALYELYIHCSHTRLRNETAMRLLIVENDPLMALCNRTP